ncbi:MAG: hypothetical protein R6U84_08570 [Candidatus Cloacimonadales bacterium]
MKKIWLSLAILLLILISFSLYWRSTVDATGGIQVVSAENEEHFTLRKLAKFETAKIVLARESEEDYQGFKLQKLLETMAVEDFRSVIISSTDGLSVSLKPTELSNAYLCLRQDNDQQYYQLVISTDAFMQRWLKYINRIEIR